MRVRDGLDRRQARSVRDLVAALSKIPVDGPPALEAHIREIREVLDVDAAVAYGVVDAGDRLDVRFIHGAGTVDVDFLHIRKAFGAWLGDFLARRDGLHTIRCGLSASSATAYVGRAAMRT